MCLCYFVSSWLKQYPVTDCLWEHVAATLPLLLTAYVGITLSAAILDGLYQVLSVGHFVLNFLTRPDFTLPFDSHANGKVLGKTACALAQCQLPEVSGRLGRVNTTKFAPFFT